MIDTHTHLTDPVYEGGEAALARAKSAGVSVLIAVGYNIDSSEKARIFAASHDGVYFAAGIHPSDCKTLDNSVIDRLSELLEDKKAVAVGEIGLDYHYGKDDADLQTEAFVRQIDLACEKDIPFIVHSRDAAKPTVDILTARAANFRRGFLMHCYSYSAETATELAKAGAYFAFGGAITFKNAKKDDIIRAIPSDRILLETDCPYLAPTPHRGETNEPAYVVSVLEKIADVLGKSAAEIEKLTDGNARRLFYKIV